MIKYELKGVDEVIAELERRLGQEAMQRISDEALKKGADLFVKVLKSSIGTSGRYAKGWTVADTTVSGPFDEGGVRTMKVHWNGPHGRYRIIHLNEWGTVRIPNPPRKGAIARARRTAEDAYREAIKQELINGLRG